MAAHDVLDDREAEPGPTQLAGARRVDPEEAFGHPRQMLACDARPAILDHDPDRRPAAERAGAVRRGGQVLAGDVDPTTLTAVLDPIVDQVSQQLIS